MSTEEHRSCSVLQEEEPVAFVLLLHESNRAMFFFSFLVSITEMCDKMDGTMPTMDQWLTMRSDVNIGTLVWQCCRRRNWWHLCCYSMSLTEQCFFFSFLVGITEMCDKMDGTMPMMDQWLTMRSDVDRGTSVMQCCRRRNR